MDECYIQLKKNKKKYQYYNKKKQGKVCVGKNRISSLLCFVVVILPLIEVYRFLKVSLWRFYCRPLIKHIFVALSKNQGSTKYSKKTRLSFQHLRICLFFWITKLNKYSLCFNQFLFVFLFKDLLKTLSQLKSMYSLFLFQQEIYRVNSKSTMEQISIFFNTTL